MTIPPLDLILLLGTAQGFILAALLWFNRKGNRLPNRLLAVLVGLLASASLAVGIPIMNPWIHLFVDFVPLIIIMPLGPLMFFYTRSLLDPDFRLGKRERRHFWLVSIDFGSKLMAWIFLFGLLFGFFEHSDNRKVGSLMDDYDKYADIPRWISVTLYGLLSYRWLARFQKMNSDLTAQQRASVRWLRQFLMVFAAFQTIWFLHLIPYILPQTSNALLDAFGWYPLYIPIAVMIYWLGLGGYFHARHAVWPEPVRKSSPAVLPDELIQETTSGLIKAMETDQLYLDPELTVEKVGRHLRLPVKTVSAVLNQHLGKSFNTFVNEYRVADVKRRLNDAASANLTLTGIAFECGFNSQATFQRTFKQMTGHSPKEYVNRQAV
ncbi:helix-turn-helix domain-containing protein [Larkinella humicola]|uniref:Helix-turn-helix transcriptional regulator n=1 Tax=Larkinella humicola TaxID=2607654 RepID=A0A5N1JEX3_9BACT|nr:AraC family transcriptional regulator [Larkinella humicola]KAA9349279.1 helix-turn-helix transcriptional regulator [Larkinella humicola]